MSNTERTNTIVSIVAKDCIGCGRCVPVCPVDAISGILQKPHIVREEYCIGCDWCVEECPVDCIEIIPNTVQLNEQALLLRKKKLTQLHKEKKIRIATQEEALDEMIQQSDFEGIISELLSKKINGQKNNSDQSS
ncbi:MAG: RnfABCDGE type electron transport complex subunit B [Methylacidiphilales bacterium]|nr:RnfABCDGE type electron transport complex subunit B [Candidatus Methylacidiphilales bacterium]